MVGNYYSTTVKLIATTYKFFKKYKGFSVAVEIRTILRPVKIEKTSWQQLRSNKLLETATLSTFSCWRPLGSALEITPRDTCRFANDAFLHSNCILRKIEGHWFDEFLSCVGARFFDYHICLFLMLLTTQEKPSNYSLLLQLSEYVYAPLFDFDCQTTVLWWSWRKGDRAGS